MHIADLGETSSCLAFVPIPAPPPVSGRRLVVQYRCGDATLRAAMDTADLSDERPARAAQPRLNRHLHHAQSVFGGAGVLLTLVPWSDDEQSRRWPVQPRQVDGFGSPDEQPRGRWRDRRRPHGLAIVIRHGTTYTGRRRSPAHSRAGGTRSGCAVAVRFHGGHSRHCLRKARPRPRLGRQITVTDILVSDWK